MAEGGRDDRKATGLPQTPGEDGRLCVWGAGFRLRQHDPGGLSAGEEVLL